MKQILGILLLFSAVLVKAQELIPYGEMKSSRPVSQYTIKEWNIDNGLPNNAILDVEQTSDGYLWLATFNGLTRFDGIEFTVFNHSNAIEFATDHISSLIVDDKDQLWIGTNGGGLLRYHQGSFKVFDASSVNGSIITALAKGQDSVLWVGTRNGLLKFNSEIFETIDRPELANVNITALYQDQKQRLWIGTTTNGLYVMDKNAITNFTVKDGLKSNFIYRVFTDSQGIVWVGTDRGLSMMGSGIQDMESYPNAPTGYVNDFLEDHRGNIWLASKDGLYRFRNSFEKVDPDKEVGHHIVQSLFEDREKNIWAGTYRVGLSRLNQSKFVLLGEYEGLTNEVINVTYSDKSKHWVGTDYGLIRMMNGEMTTFMLDQRASGNRVRDILRDSKGRLWVCTYNGLVQFEEESVARKYTSSDGLPSNNIRRVVEDFQGNLWIATSHGLSKFNDETFVNYGTNSGLGDNYIMSLFVDKDGLLWVGTNGGGTYHYQDDRFIKVLSQRAANDIVFNFIQDNDRSMWLSTNRGVVYLKDSVEYSINLQQGIVSNNIFQVLLDDPGFIWFTSDRGVMRVSRDEISQLISGEISVLKDARVFDRSDGLRTGQITPASITGTSAGEIWFCTLKGVAVLNSRNIPTNELRANTLITSILTDNESYQHFRQIELPAGNRKLELHYTGLSFNAPEKVRYKYKLENFDSDWVDAASRRTAYYTNLPPGDYQFKVMAANNDGLWSESPATIQVIQGAYFYQETWFYIAVSVVLMAFGAFLYYLRAMGLNRRNFQLARMVQERTRDIQYQNEEIILQKEELNQLNTVKDKLLSVISHDLRGPIAAVSGLLGLLKSGHLNYHELIIQSNKLNTEVHNLTYLLDNLLNWSKTQMQGIKLNSETVPLREVVEQNLEMVRPISEQKKISIFNQVPEDCEVYTDVNFLSLAIRNLLMNALKFTHEKGEISITSEYHEGSVVVSVNDNGIGMSPEDLQKLFNTESHYSKMGTANEAGTGIGLLLCKEFIELDGGKIWAESTKGVGSSFKIMLKKGRSESVNLGQV